MHVRTNYFFLARVFLVAGATIGSPWCGAACGNVWVDDLVRRVGLLARVAASVGPHGSTVSDSGMGMVFFRAAGARFFCGSKLSDSTTNVTGVAVGAFVIPVSYTFAID
jgi:hypothetical protein